MLCIVIDIIFIHDAFYDNSAAVIIIILGESVYNNGITVNIFMKGASVMFDMLDTRGNYRDSFCDELNGFERLCPIIDKNVFLSLNTEDGAKMCSNYEICKNKEKCKLIEKI